VYFSVGRTVRPGALAAYSLGAMALPLPEFKDRPAGRRTGSQS